MTMLDPDSATVAGTGRQAGRPATDASATRVGQPNAGEKVAVECRNVWKLFGSLSDRELADIRARNLGKAEALRDYQCVVGVADVSFSAKVGQVFCIMGLSGSGKSTLVRHINGLIKPTAGEILIDGDDITRMRSDALRSLRASKIGMVFQHFALLPHRSVIENVAFGLEIRGVPRRARMDRSMEMLELVRLQEWAARKPHELSGGMQQRVGLARALAGDPDILIMDEPFSALDPLIRRQLQDEFLELTRMMGKTTIFITHDLDEAIRLGSRIAIMRDGRFVQEGTALDIVQAPKNEYVAEFVKNVSRLHLLRASDIMNGLPKDGVAPGARRVPHSAELAVLVRHLADSNEPIVIVDPSDLPVGIVDRTIFLRALRE